MSTNNPLLPATIERLEALVANFTHDALHEHVFVYDCARLLLAEREQYKQDAERYRFLRPLLGKNLRLTGGKDSVFALPFPSIDLELRTTKSYGYTDEIVDEAVDTGIKNWPKPPLPAPGEGR